MECAQFSVFFFQNASTNASASTSTAQQRYQTQNSRNHSSVHTQQPARPVPEVDIDPYVILSEELKCVYDDVREVSAIQSCF